MSRQGLAPSFSEWAPLHAQKYCDTGPYSASCKKKAQLHQLVLDPDREESLLLESMSLLECSGTDSRLTLGQVESRMTADHSAALDLSKQNQVQNPPSSATQHLGRLFY